MTALEYINLSGNSLTEIGEAFTTKLDKQFRMQRFEVNAQRASFVCDCFNLPFVLCICDTDVILTGEDRLTYTDRNN